MRGRSLRLRVAVACAAAAALVVGATVAQAAGGGTLTLQAFPATVVSGGTGALLATFQNTGTSTLTHVVVTVDIGGASFAGGSSGNCSATATGGSCALGNVPSGGTVKETIAFTVAADATAVTFDGTATWNAASVGKPKGAPTSSQTTSASAGADVLSLGSLAAANSSCDPGGGSLSATADNGQQIYVQAGDNTLGLSCTPIVAGIDGSNVLFTKLPPLNDVATVVLTFTDENLPWPVDAFGTLAPESRDDFAGSTLYEYPSYPNTETTVSVPPCNADGSLPSSPGEGQSTDSCVFQVAVSGDYDEDADAGTITLHVQGSATGDPGYPGG